MRINKLSRKEHLYDAILSFILFSALYLCAYVFFAYIPDVFWILIVAVAVPLLAFYIFSVIAFIYCVFAGEPEQVKTELEKQCEELVNDG